MKCNFSPYKEYDIVALKKNLWKFSLQNFRNATKTIWSIFLPSELVSSFSLVHAGSGISHGVAPTTNALNLRFFHSFRLLYFAFSISLFAKCRISDAKELKALSRLSSCSFVQIVSQIACLSFWAGQSNHCPKRVSMLALKEVSNDLLKTRMVNSLETAPE